MSGEHRPPPRLAEWLLLRLLPSGLVARDIAGDCREEYQEFIRERRMIPAAAPLWYWIHALRIIVRMKWPSRSGSRRGLARLDLRGRGDWSAYTFRHALRSLVRRKAFSAMAIVTLALGIGATTAMFTVAEFFLYRPMSFPESNRIVRFFSFNPEMRIGLSNVSYPDFEDWRAQDDLFASASVFRRTSLDLSGGDTPERINVATVRTDFFRVLGTRPILGRMFDAADYEPGNPQVIVLSDRLWQRRYGADSSLVGRSVRLNGVPYTVIGVVGDDGLWPVEARAWIPVRFEDGVPTNRGNHNWNAIARLQPGVSTEVAAERVSTLTRRARVGATGRYEPGMDATAIVLAESVVEPELRILFVVLIGAVLSVLLIACINVSNLFLTQASIRSREMAVRSALGAARGRLVAQLMTESIIVALAGGLAGLLLARVALTVAVQFAPAEAGITVLNLSPVVLLISLACTLVASVVSGLVPAVKAARADATDAIKDGGGAATTGKATQRMRRFLVGAEVAVSMVLLIMGGLLIRALQQTLQADPGYRVENVIGFHVTLPSTRYPNPDQIVQFHEAALARLSDLSSVESVALTSRIPSGEGLSLLRSYFRDDEPDPPEGRGHEGTWFEVSASLIETLDIEMVAGRFISDRDGRSAAPVIVVNQAMANELSPDGDVIGMRIRSVYDEKLDREIVGVMSNVAFGGVVQAGRPSVFVPHAQSVRRRMAFLVRTADDPAEALPAIRAAFTSLDGDLAMAGTTTLQEVLDLDAGFLRFLAVVLSTFGAIALVLAVVGVYGLTAFSVAQRTHEIGIRMALGAQSKGVQWLLVRQVGRAALIGGALGLAFSFAAARVVSSQLVARIPVGVDGRAISLSDPATFVGIALLLAGAGVLASYIPTLRATRVDPVLTLRRE